MEIAAIIPARGGSKGIPKKNIKLLNGKPLISYSITEAQKSSYITDVYVSTDDQEIARISEAYGAKVPYLRPSNLSIDSSPTIDSILHMTEWLLTSGNKIPEYICVLQCTSPLTKASDIDGTIKKLIETGMDGAVSICEAEVNPYWTNVFKGDRLEYFIEEGKNITRRQDLPEIFRLNGAIYVVKTEVLLSERTLEPKNITGYVMSNESSIDIDTMQDFMLAEFLMKEREKNA
ncbi:cytidylyltransferase domain-containing protein [Anaerosolibacter sp.]|uniref:acylneuraminate cytidylyltransferase family protein n=1 Tax=Anaerosolibacter sp. TaxID=1872527 RepID=UPI0039EEF105